MATGPNAMRMADRLLDGGLAEFIRHHRAAGVSWVSIARLLEAEHQVEVTGDTLRRWSLLLEDSAPAQAAS